MDNLKEWAKSVFGRFKKVLLVGLTGLAGVLLTLAGLNLIQISPSLILYSGISLLAVAFLFYLLA